MTDRKWAFEDFVEGSVIELGERLITAEEIIEFASEFDPQPMHLDEQAGKESILGGLAASGWHTCCIFMKMMCDTFLLDSTSQGAPGLDYVRWKKPVVAGDTIRGRCVVESARTSASRPGLGFITVRNEVLNQRDEVVMEMRHTGMFLTRAAGATK